MDDHSNRARLVDVPERRAIAKPLELREVREAGGSTALVLEGYAATWEPYDCYGGPERGGWVEQLDRTSVDRTLAEKPDVLLLVNHEGLPLARTSRRDTPGNLFLSADKHGLKMRAVLDPSDPDVQRIAPKMRSFEGRGPILDEMSFSFRVKDQEWDSSYTNRKITELSLQKGDVSVVNYGMNPGTRAVMPSDAVTALAHVSGKELLEVRKADPGDVRRAMLTLQRAWSANESDDRGDFGGKKAAPFGGKDDDEKKPDDKGDDEKKGVWVNFDGSHLLHDGTCITCQNDRAKKPHGDVKYADPGYLGPDGKPAHDGNGVARYPIDAAHVKAAWSYINMPKNQKGYTAAQLASIKSKIKAAMKAEGHDVSEGKALEPAGPPVDVAVADISHVEAVRKFGGGITLVAVMNDGSRTPLPSFRDTGSPVAAPFRPGPGGGGGGGVINAAFIGLRAAADADDDEPDDDEEDRATSSEPGGKLGGDDDKPDDDDDQDERAAGNPQQQIDAMPDDDDDDSPADMGDELIQLSVDDRLRELRKQSELPDLPSLDAALAYVRQLA